MQTICCQFSNDLGSSSLELDEDAEVLTYEEYYPYGNSSYQAGLSLAEVSRKRYRYVGMERDDESGFIYIGARYYCPWLARWLAPDPINCEMYNLHHGNPTRNLERQFVELTASSYEYCYANPILFTDPSGEQVAPNEDQKINSGDIPTEKIEKPGWLKAGLKVFLGESHQLQAQSFAYSRQQQPNVAGVAVFDKDEFNTIVVTFAKHKTVTVQDDGTNIENTEYSATYSVFRADKNPWERNQTDLDADTFFNTDPKKLFSEIVLPAPGFGSGKAAKGAYEVFQAGLKVSKTRVAQSVAKYGIKSYQELTKITGGSGMQVHHLLERRFATTLGVNAKNMLSLVVSKTDHVKFTTLWRLEIGYKNSSRAITTATATKQEINDAAKRIYRDYPQILNALNIK